MNTGSFKVGNWLAKPASNLLINKDKELRVEPKIMALLVYLANANGEVVTREVLLNKIWKHVVQDDALTNTIAHLRKALGDTKNPKRFIETIPKQGYRLIPKVIWQSESTSSDSSSRSKIGQNANFAPKRRVSDDTKQADSLLLKIAKPASLLVILAILIFAFDRVTNITNNKPVDISSSPPLQKEIVMLDPNTVAVLPFEVFSDQQEVRFFANGLTEELIHQLSADSSILVIARNSLTRIENLEDNIKRVSKNLKARYIVHGSIRQRGNKLRTTVQLIDASKGFNLWSKSFDNQLDDLFLDTQVAIGVKITSLITQKARMSTVTQVRRHPRSAKAYKFFLLAQSHMKLAKVSNYEKAIDYFQQAVDIAPNYALAYTGQAAAHLLLFQYKHTPFEDAEIKATALLENAFKIEPNLAEIYAVRGLMYTYSNDFSRAETNFRKAIKINPGLRFARHNFGYLLWRQSRSKEALVQFELALKMDPLSAISNFGVGDTLGNLGEIEKAIEHYETCRELLPENTYCYAGLSNIYGLIGAKQKEIFYSKKADSLYDENNFFRLKSAALRALYKSDINEARNAIEKALKRNTTDYNALAIDFSIHLKTNALDGFSTKLKELSFRNPSSYSINLLLGLTSYFDHECQHSIAQYKKNGEAFENSLLNIWDFQSGVSHNLNLAYCFKQREDKIRYENQLAEFISFIENLPESKFNIPGKIYNLARYYTLRKKYQKARDELNKIQDWYYIWLIEKDPILKQLPLE